MVEVKVMRSDLIFDIFLMIEPIRSIYLFIDCGV